jgi:hypothetical protein
MNTHFRQQLKDPGSKVQRSKVKRLDNDRKTADVKSQQPDTSLIPEP